MEMVLISLCITLVAFLFLKQLFKRTTITRSVNKPPSPWRLPLIGNFHQLSLYPHRCLHSLSLRYGPLMLLHFGRVPFLIVSSADAAREVMKTHDLVFSDRPNTKAITYFLDGGRDVIFSSYSEYWRNMKSVCTVHLLSSKMVQSYEKERDEEINLLMEKLDKASISSSSVNLSKLMITLTSDVVSKIALGKKYSGYDGTIDIKTLARGFVRVLGDFALGDFVPCLAWIDRIRGLDRKMKEVTKIYDDFVEKVLQEHEAVDEEKERTDFVDVLLSIQRENPSRVVIDRSDIKHIIFDMFFAATTTAASLLEWTMTELMRHPESMQKLRVEIFSCSPGDNSHVKEKEIEKMKYLKDVIKEVLRLHPPLSVLLPRVVSEDVKLMGYDIAAGTNVLINAWAIQRDTATWGPDAEEFRPERHQDSTIGYQGRDFKYIPFGSGRRLCPGIGFGMALVEVTLANLVKRFDWRVGVGPLSDDDKPDLAEATGIEVPRKFPLIVFPCSAVSPPM